MLNCGISINVKLQINDVYLDCLALATADTETDYGKISGCGIAGVIKLNMALKARTNEKEIQFSSNAGNFKYTRFAFTKHPHLTIKNEIQDSYRITMIDSQSILLA